jgi:hypothetical protein
MKEEVTAAIFSLILTGSVVLHDYPFVGGSVIVDAKPNASPAIIPHH